MWDLVDDFWRLSERIGKSLVGNYSEHVEEQLFDVLLYATDGMYWSASDGMGSSLSTQFRVDLIDPYCKPVCHELRRYNRVKLEFID